MQSDMRVRDACSAFPHSSRASIASAFVLALTIENSPFGQRHRYIAMYRAYQLGGKVRPRACRTPTRLAPTLAYVAPAATLEATGHRTRRGAQHDRAALRLTRGRLPKCGAVKGNTCER